MSNSLNNAHTDKGFYMKKIALFATLIFLATFMLAGCKTESGEKATAPKRISIVATIYPQYDWLKNVLGERADSVDLKLLVKNGADLHSFQPSAKDIATIAKADLVVYVGGESEEWIEKALAATPKEGRTEVNLMKALGDRVKEEEIVEGMQAEEEEHHPETSSGQAHEHGEEAEEHHHHDEEEEVENDEHIWLSLNIPETIKTISTGQGVRSGEMINPTVPLNNGAQLTSITIFPTSLTCFFEDQFFAAVLPLIGR